MLAGELARRGWQPLVLTEQLGEAVPRHERMGEATVIRVRSSTVRHLFTQVTVAARLAASLLRHGRHADFAIVRTMTLPALVVGALKSMRLLRIPTLVTAETGGDDDDVIALSRRPLFALSRRLVLAHDVLNGICQANLDHMRELGFPPQKISSIPNGIDVSPWETTQAPARVRRFLFLGRVERDKGVFELLHAFEQVHARHPDVTLVVAGEGGARASLEARARSSPASPAVTFRGLVAHERLGELFASVDCLVLPSYSEGMPLSVLEAAAHHRLLIASDVGDFRALFGDRIRLCRARDPHDLARAMEAAVDDPAPTADYGEIMGEVSIQSVVDRMLERLVPTG